jgi:hypothetical protein
LRAFRPFKRGEPSSLPTLRPPAPSTRPIGSRVLETAAGLPTPASSEHTANRVTCAGDGGGPTLRPPAPSTRPIGSRVLETAAGLPPPERVPTSPAGAGVLRAPPGRDSKKRRAFSSPKKQKMRFYRQNYKINNTIKIMKKGRACRRPPRRGRA